MGIVVVATVFAVAYYIPLSGPVQVFDVALQIRKAYNSTSYNLISPPAVGVPGGNGYWFSHKYDRFGSDGYYPVFTELTPNGASYAIIHVRSRAVINYTLGDYFDVWGQPLGPSQTIIYQTTNTMVWQMCVGTIDGPPNTLGTWRSELLTPRKLIVLDYYDTTGPSGGCL